MQAAGGATRRTPWYLEYQDRLRDAGHQNSSSDHVVRVNAREAIVVFEGFNFGSRENDVTITIGGQNCGPVDDTPLWKIIGDTPYLECQVQGLVVGRHQVEITVANQEVVIPPEESGLFAECPKNYFATEEGVHDCIPCPKCTTPTCQANGLNDEEASFCDGGTTAPYSRAKFWLYNGTNRINTTSTRGFALDVCLPVLEQLNPCLPDNKCKVGYVEENACSICKLGFQRDLIEKTCAKCPE